MYLLFLKVSWTHALRQIVKNCYKHHGREDLLPEYADENPATNMSNPSGFAMPNSNNLSGTMVQAINNPDGSVSIIQIDTNPSNGAVVTLADGTQATVLHAVSSFNWHYFVIFTFFKFGFYLVGGASGVMVSNL